MSDVLDGQRPTATARVRYLRVSPTKARRVVDLVRGMPASEALEILKFAPQEVSAEVYKVVASAVANAEHNARLDRDTLVIRDAYVDEGPTFKRFRPRAQGRAYRIRKRTSHITVVLEARPETPETSTAAAPTKTASGKKTASRRRARSGSES